MDRRSWRQKPAALAAWTVLTLAAGCGVDPQSPHPAPKPGAAPKHPADSILPPAPVAATAPDPGIVLGPKVSLDSANLPFEDPTTMEERESARYFLGQWVSDHGALQQLDLPPSAGLSFRRYDGTAFGTQNGLAPSHYSVDAVVSAFHAAGHGAEDIPGSPVGALGVIPYFRDTTHYTLMVATPTDAEVWMVDGLRPGDEWDAATYRRWLYQLPTPLKVGDKVRWGADIDTKAQTIQIYLQGQLMESLTDKFLQDVPHSVALLSNGNYVRYSSLILRPEP